MQIMPEYAWVGEQKGLVLTAEDLDRPEVNLQIGIGIWVICSGIQWRPGPVWRRIMPVLKVKTWLSTGLGRKSHGSAWIPYRETRQYVAKTMRTYYIYHYY